MSNKLIDLLNYGKGGGIAIGKLAHEDLTEINAAGSQTTDKEYIEREAVLKMLNRNSITKAITFADGVSVYDTIKNIPAADVAEVRRGKWEKVAAYNDGIINTVKCSICKEYQPIGEWDWQAYCPRCGAKMEG